MEHNNKDTTMEVLKCLLLAMPIIIIVYRRSETEQQLFKNKSKINRKKFLKLVRDNPCLIDNDTPLVSTTVKTR